MRKIKARRARYAEMLKTALGQDILNWLYDDDINEIMLNPDGSLLIEGLSTGKIATDKTIDEDSAERIIRLIASINDRVIGIETPILSASLPLNGERFQGWIQPVVEKPCFTIRKRARRIFPLDYYVQGKLIAPHVAQVLREAVLCRCNIVISGGASSGKTTFANALLAELDDTDNRIIVLEDMPELQVASHDTIKMTTTEHVTMRDLVKGCLRMRPDRLIVGEVRDGTALELLKAWNTGHPGGICTIHANNLKSTLSRLEDLILEAAATFSRHLILESVDYIVFLARDDDGVRRVKEVGQLMSYKNNEYQIRTIV